MQDYIYEDNLCLVKTSKYKSISFFLCFAKEYNGKEKLALNLLANFLGESSIKYKTREEMLRAKDNLYGPGISSTIKSKANLMEFIVKFTFINPKFLKDVDTDMYVDYFKEIFNNVYLSEERLQEYKKVHKDYLSRKLDKPSYLASARSMELLAEKEEALKSYGLPSMEEIDKITLDDVKKVYEDLFKEFSLHTYVVGDYDDTLIDYLKTLKTDKTYCLNNKSLIVDNLGEIIEEKEVSQSCLNIIYSTPFNRLSKDYYAFFLGNALLGGVPTSLLFDEVREKLSLCYYISVYDYKQEGLVKIHTAINSKNKDTVVSEVNKQIKRLVDKDYDPELLQMARIMMIDSVRSVNDDLDAYVEYLYTNRLNDFDVNFDEYIAELSRVTVDDVSRVFKEYKHVLTYMLEGVKNDSENL
ncbi:MAG: insulinase family protein [Erysipelotrichaceae bacterium]|nr:insulinase family protein [Erysipelotrichaceae bacterium]